MKMVNKTKNIQTRSKIKYLFAAQQNQIKKASMKALKALSVAGYRSKQRKTKKESKIKIDRKPTTENQNETYRGKRTKN